jgi:hypothetical protein
VKIYGADTETGVVVPGNSCPPLVCLSYAYEDETGSPVRVLLDRFASVSWFKETLQNHGICTRWHNGIYDVLVLLQETFEQFGIEEAESVFELVMFALHSGRISDTETREKLLLNEVGLLVDAEDSDEARGIPLHDLTKKYLNINISADKKNPDAWRLRYLELRDVSFDLWPSDAIRYAEDDAVYPLLIGKKQSDSAEATGYQDPKHPWLITDEIRKLSKRFSLHLMSNWGCRTDPERVDTITRAVADGMKKLEDLLLTEGLARLETKKGVVSVATIRRAVQDRVSLAYACEVLKLDPEHVRRVHAQDDTQASIDLIADGRLPESFRERLDSPTTKAISYLVREHGAQLVGCPAVYPKNTRVDGGGVVILINGGPTTPTTYDPKEGSDRFPMGQVPWSRLTLLGCGDNALVMLGQQGELQKLQSTYVPILQHGLVHPINPRYDEMKASGRSSCKNPNMQNMPTFGLYFIVGPDGMLSPNESGWVKEKTSAGSWTGRRSVAIQKSLDPEGSKLKLAPVGGLREAFVARPGYALLDADIDYAECVAWAQWCIDMPSIGISDMGEVINRGEDPHIHLALEFPQLAGWTYATANAAKKKDLLIKKMRQYAKSPGNFGCMGGMVAETLKEAALGYETFLELEEAEMIVNAFKRRWREANLSDQWVRKQLRASGGGTFTFVQPRSLRRRGGCTYTKGRNQAFQGGTADMADDVLVQLAMECYLGRLRGTSEAVWRAVVSDINAARAKGTLAYLDCCWRLIEAGVLSPLRDARPWAFAHDEFILEAPIERWGRHRFHLAGARLEQVIIERGKYWFPDMVTRTESASALRWRKDRRTGDEFKRVLDKDGYLIPMEYET